MKRCFSSALAVVPRSKALRATDLKQMPDGNLSGTCASGEPYTLTYVAGTGLLLTEDCFVRLALTLKWDFNTLAKEITRKITLRSRTFYKEKYRTQLARLTSERLAATTYGNARGSHPPSVILPEADFLKKVSEGFGTWQLAVHFGTSEFIVKRNLKYYGQHLQKKLAKSSLGTMRNLDMARLDRLCPGLSTMPVVSAQERTLFLEKAYYTYLTCLQDAWHLKDMCKTHFRYIREKMKLDMEEVSWSDRRHEVELALELLNAKIPFWREHPIPNYGKKRADFALINSNILLEVDGEYHEEKKDSLRDSELQALGYRVLRFSTRSVIREMPTVMEKIKEELAKPLPPSARLIYRRSGILK